MNLLDRKKPLKNQKFGDLKVIVESHYNCGTYFWVCRCWCGGTRIVEEKRLMAGRVTMCVGCETQRKMDLWEGLCNN